MSIDYCLDSACCKPSIKVTDTGKMTLPEKMCYIIDIVGEVVVLVNGFDERILKNEADIATLFNEIDKTNSDVSELDARIDFVEIKVDSNSDQIKFLVEQFEQGATGLVVDCGFFGDMDINNSYNGGVW